MMLEIVCTVVGQEVTDRAQPGEPALRAVDRAQEIGEPDLVFTAQERATPVSSGRRTT
jgi:hypothetical protein